MTNDANFSWFQVFKSILYDTVHLRKSVGDMINTNTKKAKNRF